VDRDRCAEELTMPKRRKILLIVLAVLVLLPLALLHPSFNGKHPLLTYYHHITWGDVLEVSGNENVDLDALEIVFKNELQMDQEKYIHDPRSYDRERSKPMNVVIYKNGEQVNDIPYAYGKQVLVVIYNKVEIGRLRHWQTNSYHSHRYSIDLMQVNGMITCTTRIEGPDADTVNM
jgi:hypothetical protein